MTEFVAANALERELEKAKGGRVSMFDFLPHLIESELFVPSGDEVQPDGSGFQPLLFDKGGVPMVACFTAMERINELGKLAPYCLTINGGEFLQRIPAGYGLVVNPGLSIGFDVTPDGLRKIVADL